MNRNNPSEKIMKLWLHPKEIFFLVPISKLFSDVAHPKLIIFEMCNKCRSTCYRNCLNYRSFLTRGYLNDQKKRFLCQNLVIDWTKYRSTCNNIIWYTRNDAQSVFWCANLQKEIWLMKKKYKAFVFASLESKYISKYITLKIYIYRGLKERQIQFGFQSWFEYTIWKKCANISVFIQSESHLDHQKYPYFKVTSLLPVRREEEVLLKYTRRQAVYN